MSSAAPAATRAVPDSSRNLRRPISSLAIRVGSRASARLVEPWILAAVQPLQDLVAAELAPPGLAGGAEDGVHLERDARRSRIALVVEREVEVVEARGGAEAQPAQRGPS